MWLKLAERVCQICKTRLLLGKEKGLDNLFITLVISGLLKPQIENVLNPLF